MRIRIRYWLTILVILVLLLPACSPGSSGGHCAKGLCVKVELAEPIQLNQPVPVTITAESEQDLPSIEFYLAFSDTYVQVIGDRKWQVDLKANTPVQFSSSIIFTAEGNVTVYGSLFDPSRGGGVRDFEYVFLTASGGTLNPTLKSSAGTEEPAIQITFTSTP